MKTTRKVAAWLLTLALLLTLAPPLGGTARAAGTDKSIQLGASVLATGKNTTDAATVRYGGQSWRVVGYGADSLTTGSAVANMTLLAADNIGLTQYVESGKDSYVDGYVYADSMLKTEVEAIASAFSAAEQAAVEARTLASGSYDGNNTDCVSGAAVADALLWPLSTKEANGVDAALRRLDGGTNQNWAIYYWWLRSPGISDCFAAVVGGDGSISCNGTYVTDEYGVRPAFYLNLSSVLFTSAAAGGKAGTTGALTTVGDYTGNDWKLTLLDSTGHSGFEVSETSASGAPGGTVTFQYSGATVGTNEYISALLCDSTTGAPLRYGRLTQPTSAGGTLTVTIPSTLALGTYTLKLFSEQCNGDCNTDLASAFDDVTLTVAYSVAVTPGANMTKTTASGAASQIVAGGAMTAVVYTANDSYYFPTDYASLATTTGITVARDSYTQITVSGTPTANTEIALADATAKTKPDAPTTPSATDCTTSANNDGKLTGVTADMEYKKSDATEWTSGTGSDITGLANGTYYVRVKATDTTLASDNQELTIAAYAAPTTYAVTVVNDGHGTGSASPASGASGTLVTLTASPNAGYHFKAWQVVSGGVSVAGNSFTIGTADVTVKALFEKDAPSVPSYDPDPTPPTYPPSVADAQNGTVTVSPKNPQAGDKVTITVTPDTGYQVESVTVTDAFGKNVTVKDNGDGTYVFTQPSGKVTIKVTFAPISAPTLTTAELLTRFSDLQPGAWYLEPVRYMVERGIMNGTDKGFEPNAATTQGMMEQILYNLDGNALVAPAEGEAWWTAADNWAGNGGVTDGVASHDPTAPATREVDILMMYNYARAKGYNVTARADLDQFSDAGSVSAGAREAMAWAVAMGIINGTVDQDGNIILDAQGTATRAQVAAIAQRLCENVAK